MKKYKKSLLQLFKKNFGTIVYSPYEVYWGLHYPDKPRNIMINDVMFSEGDTVRVPSIDANTLITELSFDYNSSMVYVTDTYGVKRPIALYDFIRHVK